MLHEDHLAFALLECVTKNYLSDYMNTNFDIVCKWMHLLFILLKESDRELYNYFMFAKLGPFFAISWLITWFAHDISNVDEIARVFDVVLSSHPLFVFYLCCAVSFFYYYF